jgi:hypothetical protein
MADDGREGNGSDNPGELIKYIEDFKKESEEMIKNLLFVDDLLQNLERRITLGEQLTSDELSEQLKDIRYRIGQIKQEEEEELDEEIIANNLLNKLRRWVDELV